MSVFLIPRGARRPDADIVALSKIADGVTDAEIGQDLTVAQAGTTNAVTDTGVAVYAADNGAGGLRWERVVDADSDEIAQVDQGDLNTVVAAPDPIPELVVVTAGGIPTGQFARWDATGTQWVLIGTPASPTTLTGGYAVGSTPDVAPAPGDNLDALTAKLHATAVDHQRRLEYAELGMKWAGEWDPATGAFPTAGTTPAGEPNAGLTQAFDFYEIVGTEAVIDGVTFTPGQQLLALVDTPSTSTVAGNWEQMAGISLRLPADYVPNPDTYLPAEDLEPQPGDFLNIAIRANHQHIKRILDERGFRHINRWGPTGTADDAPVMQAAVDDLIAEHVAGGGTLTPDSTAGRTGRAATKLLIEGDINIGSPWTGLVPGITLMGPTRSGARVRGVDASVRSIVPFSGLGTGDFQYGGGIGNMYIESLFDHQSCLVLPAARGIEISNITMAGRDGIPSHTSGAVSHAGQRVVADIAARDAVPIQTDDTTLVVLDASADPDVAALYALSDPGGTLPRLAAYTVVAGAWVRRVQGGMYGIHQLGLAPGGTVGGSSANYMTGFNYVTNKVVGNMLDNRVSYVTRSEAEPALRVQSSSIALFSIGAATQRLSVDPQDCTAGIIATQNTDRNDIDVVVEGGSVAVDYYFDETSGSNKLRGVFNPAKGTNRNDLNQFETPDFRSVTGTIDTTIAGVNRTNTTVMTAAQPYGNSGGTPDINLGRGTVGLYRFGAQPNPVFSLVMAPILKFTRDAVAVSADGRIPIIPFIVQTDETDPTKEATWPSVIKWNTSDGNAPSPWPTGLTHIMMQVAVDPEAVDPPEDPTDPTYYDGVMYWSATIVGQYGGTVAPDLSKFVDAGPTDQIGFGEQRTVTGNLLMFPLNPTAADDGLSFELAPVDTWEALVALPLQIDTGPTGTSNVDLTWPPGNEIVTFVWEWDTDEATSRWSMHRATGTGGSMSGADIRTALALEADTNILTDALLARVANTHEKVAGATVGLNQARSDAGTHLVGTKDDGPQVLSLVQANRQVDNVWLYTAVNQPASISLTDGLALADPSMASSIVAGESLLIRLTDVAPDQTTGELVTLKFSLGGGGAGGGVNRGSLSDGAIPRYVNGAGEDELVDSNALEVDLSLFTDGQLVRVDLANGELVGVDGLIIDYDAFPVGATTNLAIQRSADGLTNEVIQGSADGGGGGGGGATATAQAAVSGNMNVNAPGAAMTLAQTVAGTDIAIAGNLVSITGSPSLVKLTPNLYMESAGGNLAVSAEIWRMSGTPEKVGPLLAGSFLRGSSGSQESGITAVITDHAPGTNPQYELRGISDSDATNAVDINDGTLDIEVF